MVNDIKFPLSDNKLRDLFSGIANKDRVALAVSGGRDSMALMHLIYRWKQKFTPNIEVQIVTVNHNMRKASAGECEFVRKASTDYGFTHKILSWEHEPIVTCIQERARNARYQLILDYIRKVDIDTILTAHTADDNIETFFMRLAKGSGLNGLKSINKIRYENGSQIMRPLLSLSRALITEILTSTNNEWIDDPTNKDTNFERVRVRNNIDLLSKLNISSDNLTKTIQRLDRTHEALSYIADSISRQSVKVSQLGYAEIDFDKLCHYPNEIILRVFAKALTDINGGKVSLSSLENIYEGILETTKSMTLNGCLIIPQNNKYIIVRESRGITPIEVNINEQISWDGRFDVQLKSCNRANIIIDQMGRSDDLGKMIDGTSFQKIPKLALKTLPGGFIEDKLVLLPNTHNIYYSGYLDVKFKICEEKRHT